MAGRVPAVEPAAELRRAALRALLIDDAAAKVDAVRALAAAGAVADPSARLAAPERLPGRPRRPVLVAPGRLARRAAGAIEGRAALLHALAHIEFNAINLALDAIWRFGGLPHAYYADWRTVAADEAHHFVLLRERLRTLGHDYGDFAAHDGLWQMAEKTRDDVLARMALVPRTLEARALDASPRVRARLAGAGDEASAAVIDVILRDEIGHVAIGDRWFRLLCRNRGLDPLAAGRSLSVLHGAPRPRGPFNIEARRAAGFTAQEIDALDRPVASHAS